jgi:hypothetical protein
MNERVSSAEKDEWLVAWDDDSRCHNSEILSDSLRESKNSLNWSLKHKSFVGSRTDNRYRNGEMCMNSKWKTRRRIPEAMKIITCVDNNNLRLCLSVRFWGRSQRQNILCLGILLSFVFGPESHSRSVLELETCFLFRFMARFTGSIKAIRFTSVRAVIVFDRSASHNCSLYFWTLQQ